MPTKTTIKCPNCQTAMATGNAIGNVKALELPYSDMDEE
jgi:hypothetical protein